MGLEISVCGAFRLLLPELCAGNCSWSFAVFAKSDFWWIHLLLFVWNWFYIHSFAIFTLVQFSRLHLPHTTTLLLSSFHRPTLPCFALSTKCLQSPYYLRTKSARLTVLTRTVCTGFNMCTSPPWLYVLIATNLSRKITISPSPTFWILLM